MKSERTDRSFWVIGGLFFLFAIPLEIAIVWSIYKMGGWAVPFFSCIFFAFMFGPEQSRSYLAAGPMRSLEKFRVMIHSINPQPHSIIPRPPGVPQDLLALLNSSTMPAPPMKMSDFNDTMRRVTTRPPPSIN